MISPRVCICALSHFVGIFDIARTLWPEILKYFQYKNYQHHSLAIVLFSRLSRVGTPVPKDTIVTSQNIDRLTRFS